MLHPLRTFGSLGLGVSHVGCLSKQESDPKRVVLFKGGRSPLSYSRMGRPRGAETATVGSLNGRVCFVCLISAPKKFLLVHI